VRFDPSRDRLQLERARFHPSAIAPNPSVQVSILSAKTFTTSVKDENLGVKDMILSVKTSTLTVKDFTRNGFAQKVELSVRKADE